MEFFILLLVALFLAFTGYYVLRNEEQPGGYSLLCFLYVISTLSWGFTYIDAPDIPKYIEYFQTSTTNWFEDGFSNPTYNSFESGFTFLANLSRTISDKFYIFQCLLYSTELLLITIGFKCFFNEKTALILLCGLFIILPINLLSALRQGVAISVFIFSLQFIKNRQIIPYIACLLFASFFHKSVLFLIPVYFVPWLSSIFKKRWIYWAILIAFNLLYFFNISLSTFFNSFLLDSLLFYDDASNYSMYLTEELSSNFGILKILELDFIYIFFCILHKEQSSEYVIIKYLFVTYFFVNVVLGGILAHRISYYFAIISYASLIFAFMNAAKTISFPKRYGYAIACLYIIVINYFYFNEGNIETQFTNMLLSNY